jgi:hypothetical protein
VATREGSLGIYPFGPRGLGDRTFRSLTRARSMAVVSRAGTDTAGSFRLHRSCACPGKARRLSFVDPIATGLRSVANPAPRRKRPELGAGRSRRHNFHDAAKLRGRSTAGTPAIPRRRSPRLGTPPRDPSPTVDRTRRRIADRVPRRPGYDQRNLRTRPRGWPRSSLGCALNVAGDDFLTRPSATEAKPPRLE